MNADYITLKVASVANAISFTGDYCNAAIGVENSTKSIALTGDYTNIQIKMAGNYSFDFAFTGDYLSVNGLNGAHFTQKYEKDSQVSYKGYYNARGNSSISLNSNYGNIKFVIK